MYFEDYISQLRKHIPSAKFNTHFTTWLPIMKKIEERFIMYDRNYPFTNWAERIRDPQMIGIYDKQQRNKIISALPDDVNYFILVEPRMDVNQKILLYEATPDIILTIISGISGNCYIADKKYNWFTCLTPDHQESYRVVKSGILPTPLEQNEGHLM